MNNPYLDELRNDDKFKADWPYVSDRLRKFLLARQQQFALEHPGEYQVIGQYVEFQANIFRDLEEIDSLTQSSQPKARRPGLNNSAWKTQTQAPHARTQSTSTTEGGSGT